MASYLKNSFLANKVCTLLGVALTLLGVCSCGDDDEADTPANLNRAKLEVKGTVADAEGSALEGIDVNVLVAVQYSDSSKIVYQNVSGKATTSADGKYEFAQYNYQDYFEIVKSFRVKASDPNGVYAPDTIDVNYTIKDLNNPPADFLAGKDYWHGTYSATVDFKLNKLETSK